MKPTYNLFPNCASYEIWLELNCNGCLKAEKCDIETEIMRAVCSDGTLPKDKAADIAQRLGWNGQAYFRKHCPECRDK